MASLLWSGTMCMLWQQAAAADCTAWGWLNDDEQKPI